MNNAARAYKPEEGRASSNSVRRSKSPNNPQPETVAPARFDYDQEIRKLLQGPNPTRSSRPIGPTYVMVTERKIAPRREDVHPLDRAPQQDQLRVSSSLAKDPLRRVPHNMYKPNKREESFTPTAHLFGASPSRRRDEAEAKARSMLLSQ